jgi:hypothetical protein
MRNNCDFIKNDYEILTDLHVFKVRECTKTVFGMLTACICAYRHISGCIYRREPR